MEYWDLDDYVEEVKYLMTEYEDLTEEIILAWEERVREWVEKNIDGKALKKKSDDEILIKVKDENIFWDMALKYNNYYRKNKVEEYWKEFSLTKAY